MAIDFEIKDRQIDDATHVVAVTGEIDLFTAPEFKQRVAEPIDAGRSNVIVDAAVPGVGNVIEQLADELSVTPEGETEFLYVRLAYTNGR